MVQVAKEPIGTKGARSTSYVSLPGRNLVFMPTVDHVGISRRIGTRQGAQAAARHRRLDAPAGRGLHRAHRRRGRDREGAPGRHGVPHQAVELDPRQAEDAQGAGAALPRPRSAAAHGARSVHAATSTSSSSTARREYERLLKFVGAFMPRLRRQDRALRRARADLRRLRHRERDRPRARAQGRGCKLGRLADHRPGRSAHRDRRQHRQLRRQEVERLEETITKTNLEACKEIADQLRLRNIGGIIIVDFIDMDKEQNRDKVMRAFEEALKARQGQANVTKISELGLVEMTRKRTRESLGRMLTEPCPYCEGKGYIKSKTTVCYEILRQLRRDGHSYPRGRHHRSPAIRRSRICSSTPKRSTSRSWRSGCRRRSSFRRRSGFTWRSSRSPGAIRAI